MTKYRHLKKHTLAVLSVLLLITVAFLLLDRESKTANEIPVEVPKLIKTEVLENSSTTISYTYPGKVQAARKVDLAFRVSGQLMEVPIKRGQHVKAGDLLAKLDPRDFQIALDSITARLGQAQAQMAAMKAGAREEDLRSLEANVASAQAQMNEAEAQYERFKNLWKEEMVSESEYERYETMWQVSRSSYQAAIQNLKKGKAGSRTEDIQAMEWSIKALEAEQRSAQASLDDTELRAPFSGVVADRAVENYENISAGYPVLSLQDMTELEIVINVPDRDIIIADPTRDCIPLVYFDAFPERSFEAYFKEIKTNADPSTQTYAVTVAMDYPTGLNVLPGMSVSLKADIPSVDTSHDGNFIVPSSAIFADENGGNYLWVVDQETRSVEKRNISVGSLDGGNIEISGDIRIGERIATAGVHLLREGQIVRFTD